LARLLHPSKTPAHRRHSYHGKLRDKSTRLTPGRHRSPGPADALPDRPGTESAVFRLRDKRPLSTSEPWGGTPASRPNTPVSL